MRTSALARFARVVLACLCLALLGLNPARAQNTSPTVSLSVNYTPGVATTSVSLNGHGK